MLVFKFKACGKQSKFNAVDEAIRTAKFIRNSCLRYWIDNKKVGRYDLNGSSVLTAAQILALCQKSKARISKLLKFVNPNPPPFNNFNFLLIPSTLPFVVLLSKYPATSANYRLIVATLFF